MSKEYKIETIHDCMEIPIEKFNDFLAEFNEALQLARGAHEINKEISGSPKPVSIRSFTWIDDGKKDGKVRITIHNPAIWS